MKEREFSSGGIVMKRGAQAPKVLLIKDSYGRWTWPKGKINKEETPEEAAIREIKEEVGLKDLELVEKIGKTRYFYRLKGKLIFKTVDIYLFKCSGKEKLKILYKEIRGGQWFAPEEALEKLDYKGAKDFLKKAIRLFTNPEKKSRISYNNRKGG